MGEIKLQRRSLEELELMRFNARIGSLEIRCNALEKCNIRLARRLKRLDGMSQARTEQRKESKKDGANT